MSEFRYVEASDGPKNSLVSWFYKKISCHPLCKFLMYQFIFVEASDVPKNSKVLLVINGFLSQNG